MGTQGSSADNDISGDVPLLPTSPLRRRWLLRGGLAALAGAAVVTVAALAVGDGRADQQAGGLEQSASHQSDSAPPWASTWQDGAYRDVVSGDVTLDVQLTSRKEAMNSLATGQRELCLEVAIPGVPGSGRVCGDPSRGQTIVGAVASPAGEPTYIVGMSVEEHVQVSALGADGNELAIVESRAAEGLEGGGFFLLRVPGLTEVSRVVIEGAGGNRLEDLPVRFA